MTEKNIFVHKLFLSLNISDFNLFFMWKLQPPLKKVTPVFPSNPPLKVEILSSPLFFKIWLEVQPPCKNRGLHTMAFDNNHIKSICLALHVKKAFLFLYWVGALSLLTIIISSLMFHLLNISSNTSFTNVESCTVSSFKW